MPASKVLPRLLRLRELEEEQSRAELDASVRMRNGAADELDLAVEQQNKAREMFASAIDRQNSVERAAATFELARLLGQRTHSEQVLAAAENEVENRRDAFLIKRMSRQQVAKLVEEQMARGRETANRRAQQMLDDWYGRKRSGPVVESPSLDEAPPMKFS